MLLIEKADGGRESFLGRSGRRGLSGEQGCRPFWEEGGEVKGQDPSG